MIWHAAQVRHQASLSSAEQKAKAAMQDKATAAAAAKEASARLKKELAGSQQRCSQAATEAKQAHRQLDQLR